MWRSHIRREELHHEFVIKAKEFVQRCTPEKEADVEGNPRGNHWFCIAGYDRQNKKASALLSCSKKLTKNINTGS
jgi:hypothetical protein